MIKIEPIYNILDYHKIFHNEDGSVGSNYAIVDDYIQFIDDYIALYRDNLNNLEYFSALQQVALPESIFKKFYGLYDLTNETISSLKLAIKTSHKEQTQTCGGLKCVYCGIQRQKAEDLDHYLPRSIFPEFSILSYNLIYVCKTCNQDYKKALFVEADGMRCILNPYFDAIEGINFLTCIIDFTDPTFISVEYKVKTPSLGDDTTLYKVAENHFLNLNLNERYSEIIIEECWNGFLNNFTEGDDDNRKFLNNELSDYTFYIDIKIKDLGRTHASDFEKLFWEELKLNTTWLLNLPNRCLKTGQICV